MDFDHATSYAKQKESVGKEFETFLASPPGYITLAAVTPRDICRLLVFKDKNGKTQFHAVKVHRPSGSIYLWMSYMWTVDSYIGKLRAFYNLLDVITSVTSV